MPQAKILGASLFCFAAILLLGVTVGRLQVEEKAVNRGAARWVIDSATGEKSLEWCECFGNTERDK